MSDRAALLLVSKQDVTKGESCHSNRAKIFCLGQGQGQTVDALNAGRQR